MFGSKNKEKTQQDRKAREKLSMKGAESPEVYTR